MALATSSSLATFTSDAHHRVTAQQLQRCKMNCILRPADGLLKVTKLSKFPSIAIDAENRRIKSYHVKCSYVEATAESITSANAQHYPRIADSEGSSLHLLDNQLDSPSERVIKDKEGAGGPKLKDGSPKVNRRGAMLASMAAFGAGISCSCCKAAMAVEDWSYGGPSGASKWSGTCAIGARQSPIDVPIKKAQHGEALGELLFDYKLCSPSFKNPGHGTMQVNLPEGANKLRLKGREFNLVQFHFHTPSEHAFDGLRFPMEAHLVHRTHFSTAFEDAVTKAYAVLGVMLDASLDVYSNNAIAAALRYSPLEHGKTLTVPNVQVSANDLLPPKVTKNDRRYIHYFGSFTTPPCSESVDWFLLEKPLRVSTSEVLEFMKFVGDEQTLALNARPVQPLGDREIFEGP